MIAMPLVRCLLALAVVLATAASAAAEVVRVAVTSRSDAPSDYEKIVGKVYFAVDPRLPGNARIVDIDRAPRNAAGQVEFSADLYVLRPKNGSSTVALIDVVNRGRLTVLSSFNRPGWFDDAEFGDAFLMKRGMTVVAVGWEFDVPARPGAIRIDVPAASEGGRAVTPLVTGQYTPDRAERAFTVGDLVGYTPADSASADATLTVRTSVQSAPRVLPRGSWTLAGNTVTTTGMPFEAGRIYELTYRAASAPVAGLGFAAVRDIAAWVRHDTRALASARYLYAFGNSQSGRFLRTFLYQGFNADEQGQQVFDGVMANISGAARLDLNRRGSTPTTLGGFSATGFPFADTAQRDPVSGVTEGLLDNERARRVQPKIFFTNTGVEYWGGGRSAALIHMSPDGARDVSPGENTRVYFFAGTQHGPGAFPPEEGAGQQRGNPTDYWWSMRALLVAMDRWVREGTAPPANNYPRLDKGTLVAVSAVAFPAIPGVQSPTSLKPVVRIANPFIRGGGGEGTVLPYLVPQVDADGNERAGIRLPDVAVPLATYTGWNFRLPSAGAPDRLVPLLGSYIPLARTRDERVARKDPRLSVAERYPSRERYLAAFREAAGARVREGYLLPDDVNILVRRAGQHWDLLAGVTSTSASR
jgi:hypothetical protein